MTSPHYSLWLKKNPIVCLWCYIFPIHPVIGHLGCDQCCRKCKCLCSMLTWSPLANTKESYDHALYRSVFSILRNYHTIFHHGWTSWHSHQQCLSFVPTPPYPHLPQYLHIILIHISLMSNEVEQFLKAYWMFESSFETILFLSFDWVAWNFYLVFSFFVYFKH